MPPRDTALDPADDANRLAVVRALGLMDAAREERFDRVSRVLAALLDVPVAYVSLVDDERQHFVGCVGMHGDADVSREETFCQHTVVSGRQLVVPDLGRDERFASSRFVTEDGYRFYAGHPLRVRGHVVGTLCAVDRRPRDLSEAQRSHLADVATWAEAELAASEFAGELGHDREFASMLTAVRERDELILQFADLAIYGVDRDGYVTFANPAAAHLLGDSLENLVGSHFHDAYHHTRADGSPFPWQECATRDVLTLGVRRRVPRDLMHRRDGTPVEVEYNSAPLVVDGEVVGAVVTISDITQRRAVERLKDEFVSVVSHELRTPLTSIRGSLGLIASGRFGELPPQGARLVEIALGNTERLVRLVNDILDLERIEAGKVELARRAQPVAPILHAARDAVSGVADERDVEIHVQVDGDPQADVDVDLMVRALTNLVGNAVKFSTPGDEVIVSARADGPDVVLQVKDRGRGIPTDKLGRIFERFEQVDTSDAREKGGTGLGLAITRSIVDRHGGTIDVESELGAGSAFSIRLPVPQPSQAAAQVVLVEDDRDLVELVTAGLEPLGVSVASAPRVEDAVALIRRTRPALIVLDVALEGGSGYEVVRQLREQSDLARTPVLVTTVHDLDADQRGQLVLGDTRFVSKGAGKELVAAVVDAVRAELARDKP